MQLTEWKKQTHEFRVSPLREIISSSGYTAPQLVRPRSVVSALFRAPRAISQRERTRMPHLILVENAESTVRYTAQLCDIEEAGHCSSRGVRRRRRVPQNKKFRTPLVGLTQRALKLATTGSLSCSCSSASCPCKCSVSCVASPPAMSSPSESVSSSASLMN